MMVSVTKLSMLLFAVTLSILLQTPCVESGIIKGFKQEVPPVEELLPTFEHTTRQLVTDDHADGLTSGPRGGVRDASPKLEPTEISFMIMMDNFGYSKGASTLEEISIGTKFAFSGRIVTRAEELGKASGTCTVTSSIEKELSYCQFYHRIDTDNFGGYGTVVISGSADEIGGRLLVTGTGGSFESVHEGFASVQFDPAGNPVIYVLLKLF
ncbi:hypothetical protein IV203_034585 [Nitzschia inconspicua]|uniref:Dirigent protein n=1 Tax=Nitzschia inconspicua TaxID=303405 RepID=A0A9K3PTV1_9STRA|nr:hypothetical protein IV203_002644 [Nitzschia inconspicua]KAG7359487.1 hypothetical protein IV203_034585 [Nitzschia inconspicua]